MKKISVLFLLLVVSCLSASAQEKLWQLEIHTNEKTSVHGVNFWNKIILISKQDKKEYTIGSSGRLELTELPEGKYKIIVVSRFHQQSEKIIHLTKNRRVNFCLSRVLKKIKPKVFSEQMESGDTLFVLHNASGMSVDAREIRVAKTQNKFFGLYYENGILLQQMELNENQVRFVSKIEMYATKFEAESGCSVIESYTFAMNGKYYSVNDRTCTWGGFNALCKKIFD